MTRFRSTRGVTMVALLLCAGSAVAEAAEAQAMPLRPNPLNGYVIAPFMEGWYDNGDGTYTISFGYLNRNEDVVEIPVGENNFIEPAQFDGMQPTVFDTGHPRGIFTVTLPAGMAETDVWWTIRYPDGEEARVPGRIGSGAYQLDYFPRPHGTVAPVIWFEEGGETGQWPAGVASSSVETTSVGELLTLTVSGEDVSERDPEDTRVEEGPIALTFTWAKHQGPPGEVEWVRHPSTPIPEPDPPDGRAGGPGGGDDDEPPPPEVITLEEGSGTVLVQARFSSPGVYLLRVRADQFGSATDSGAGGQCCWTNGYVTVSVTP